MFCLSMVALLILSNLLEDWGKVIRYHPTFSFSVSLALLQAKNEKLIKGVKVGKQGFSFIHLLFADDSLLFFHNDHSSHDNIRKTVEWYCKISGQSINHQKSELFCSPNLIEEEKNSLDQCLQVNLVQKPSKYLGVDFKLKGKRIPRSRWDATK